MTNIVLALDTLVDNTDIEEATALACGWRFEHWDGAASALASADAIVHVVTRVDPVLLVQLGRCRVIGRFGTGLDTVDLEATARAGMAVVGVRDYCTRELSAHTVALALSLLRLKGRTTADGSGVQPGWSSFRNQYPLRGDLTAQIVGYGAVGSTVAGVLRSLSITPLVTTRHCRSAAEGAGFEVVPLTEGISRSDLVLFHLDLSTETRGIFGPDALAAVKNDVVIVNTAAASTNRRANARRWSAKWHLRRSGAGRPALSVEPHLGGGWSGQRHRDPSRRLVQRGVLGQTAPGHGTYRCDSRVRQRDQRRKSLVSNTGG